VTFVKLDCGVLDSSLWIEPPAVVKVFLTMLAMCTSEGVCEATAPGISRRAVLPIATVRRALAKLEAPDPDDRSGVDGGRRIKRVPGGYLVVNYLAYRRKDHGAAERKRRQRERERGMSRVTSRPVTQGEVEGEGEGEQTTDSGTASPAGEEGEQTMIEKQRNETDHGHSAGTGNVLVPEARAPSRSALSQPWLRAALAGGLPLGAAPSARPLGCRGHAGVEPPPRHCLRQDLRTVAELPVGPARRAGGRLGTPVARPVLLSGSSARYCARSPAPPRSACCPSPARPGRVIAGRPRARSWPPPQREVPRLPPSPPSLPPRAAYPAFERGSVLLTPGGQFSCRSTPRGYAVSCTQRP
jgi:hypothetical protein